MWGSSGVHTHDLDTPIFRVAWRIAFSFPLQLKLHWNLFKWAGCRLWNGSMLLHLWKPWPCAMFSAHAYCSSWTGARDTLHIYLPDGVWTCSAEGSRHAYMHTHGHTETRHHAKPQERQRHPHAETASGRAWSRTLLQPAGWQAERVRGV